MKAKEITRNTGQRRCLWSVLGRVLGAIADLEKRFRASFGRRLGRVLGAIADLGQRFRASFGTWLERLKD